MYKVTQVPEQRSRIVYKTALWLSLYVKFTYKLNGSKNLYTKREKIPVKALILHTKNEISLIQV